MSSVGQLSGIQQPQRSAAPDPAQPVAPRQSGLDSGMLQLVRELPQPRPAERIEEVAAKRERPGADAEPLQSKPTPSTGLPKRAALAALGVAGILGAAYLGVNRPRGLKTPLSASQQQAPSSNLERHLLNIDRSQYI